MKQFIAFIALVHSCQNASKRLGPQAVIATVNDLLNRSIVGPILGERTLQKQN